MANVLNPEPESITLNTELETPTLEPATELEQPSYESTSNPETAEAHPAVESQAMDADASTEPVAQADPAQHQHTELVEPVAHVAHSAEHSPESAEDFSAALEAFEREQAADEVKPADETAGLVLDPADHGRTDEAAEIAD